MQPAALMVSKSFMILSNTAVKIRVQTTPVCLKGRKLRNGFGIQDQVVLTITPPFLRPTSGETGGARTNKFSTGGPKRSQSLVKHTMQRSRPSEERRLFYHQTTESSPKPCHETQQNHRRGSLTAQGLRLVDVTSLATQVPAEVDADAVRQRVVVQRTSTGRWSARIDALPADAVIEQGGPREPRRTRRDQSDGTCRRLPVCNGVSANRCSFGIRRSLHYADGRGTA